MPVVHMTEPRKHSKMEFCDKHRWSFMSKSVYRRAETMVEGGWANGGACEGGKCRLWPGRDYYVAEICHDELDLPWTRGE